MGIPTYFKDIFYKYNDVIINNELKIDNFFMDLNCLIHPCTNNLDNDEEIINKIINQIQLILEYVKPQKLLYIAIDGVCPISKMITQKKRRLKSVKDKQEITEIYKEFNKNYKYWNTNQISPGTNFMNKLNISISDYLKKINIKYKFSSSDIEEEGEQKIIKYIRNNKILHNQINCIYGLDSDLIILSLGLNIDNIYLCRESVNFFGTYSVNYNKFVYFDINLFKSYIINELDPNKKLESENIIQDYIFLSFFLGNDFVIKLPSISIRYNGITELFKSYKKIKDKLNRNLIINSNKFIINYNFFFNLIKDLSEKEELLLQNIHRNFEKKQIEFNYSNEMSELDIILKKRNIIDYHSIDNKLNYSKKGYKKRYYDLYFNIKKDDNIDEYYSKKNEICYNYFKSLKWCMQYYSNNRVPDWNYYYNYNHGPFISDLYFYLINNKKNIFKEIKFNYNTKPLTTNYQLSLILPKEDFNLLPKKYSNIFNEKKILKYYPDINNLEIDYIYKLFKYEGVLLFNIDFNIIIDTLNSI